MYVRTSNTHVLVGRTAPHSAAHAADRPSLSLTSERASTQALPFNDLSCHDNWYNSKPTKLNANNPLST
jgi:hypothetical protein